MRREYRGMSAAPRVENVERRRVWLAGYCGFCWDAFGVKVPVEFVPGYQWVLAGTCDPCVHQPKETSK